MIFITSVNETIVGRVFAQCLFIWFGGWLFAVNLPPGIVKMNLDCGVGIAKTLFTCTVNPT